MAILNNKAVFIPFLWYNINKNHFFVNEPLAASNQKCYNKRRCFGGMGMLTKIALTNYKSFRDETIIPIKPLTLLCGVNSSGKSSILKSILMIKQTTERESPYNQLAFNGQYVNNGFWDDIVCVNGYPENPIEISNTFELYEHDASFSRQDNPSFRELKKLFFKYSTIHSFQIEHKIRIKGVHGSNRVTSYIENNIVVFSGIKIIVKDSNNNVLCESSVSISSNKDSHKKRYFIKYNNLPCDNEFVNSPLQNYYYTCYFNNIKLINFYKENIDPEVVRAKSSILAFFNIASSQYTGTNYIAPLRQFPQRNYIIQGDVNSVGVAGENMPILLAKLQQSGRTTNVQLSELDEKNFRPKRQRGFSPTYERIQNWIDYFGLGSLDISGNNGLLSLTLNGRNITDVGFGASQALPVIVQGLYMPCDATLFLEQPEIHLHPKMQMKMADFLLATAISERSLVVETHSDHIINRIVRRVMESIGTENDLSSLVKIYFISQDDEGCSKVCDDIKIDPVKGLIDCPREFFDQYGDELRVIMKQGYENLKNGK